MKRFTLILTMLLMLLVPAVAQKHDGKKSREAMRKEMRDFKVRYLVQEMDLNADQKEKFETLYAKMSEERWAVFHETKKLERKVKDAQKANDADYEATLKAMNAAKKKDAEIEKNYDAQFAKFLTPKQIYKMKEAEQAFFDRMQKMHKDMSKEKRKERRTEKKK